MEQDCVAYCRVSTDLQVAGHGFTRQEKSIRNYATANKLKVVHIYKESISGTTESRPVFTSMIQDLLSNGVRTIVVEDLSRLAREYRVQETLLIFLASKKINLIAANTGENITEAIMGDPMRKALVQIQGIFAELEKNLLVAKLQRARKSTGRLGGRPPVYSRKLKSRIRRYRRQGKTYRWIAEKFNDEQVPCNSQKGWYGELVQGIGG